MELGQSYWLLGFWDPLITKTKQNYCQTEVIFKVISLMTLSDSSQEISWPLSKQTSQEVDLQSEVKTRNSLLQGLFPRTPLNWHCKLGSM